MKCYHNSLCNEETQEEDKKYKARRNYTANLVKLDYDVIG